MNPRCVFPAADGGAGVRPQAALAELVPAEDPLSVSGLLSAGRGHHPHAGVGAVGRGAGHRPPAAHRHRPETSTHELRRSPADVLLQERRPPGRGAAQPGQVCVHALLWTRTALASSSDVCVCFPQTSAGVSHEESQSASLKAAGRRAHPRL